MSSQLVLGEVLVDALDAALEYAEEAFDGVGVNRAVGRADAFALAVTGHAVFGELAANAEIVTGFVGHQLSLPREVVHDDRGQRREADVVHDRRAGAASLAGNESQHLDLVVEGVRQSA